MWIVLLLCILLCVALGAFVVAPLVGTKELALASSIKGFGDEQELRQALGLRDSLFEKCAFGRTREPSVDSLGPTEALDALISLCERLRNAELPYLPTTIARTLGLLLCVLFAGVAASGAFTSQAAFAQALPPGAEAGAANPEPPPLESRILPPVTAEGGALFATMHQFVLSPREGKLHVYYLGLLNNVDGLTDGKIALPLPRGFEDLRILNLPSGVLEASGRSWPVVRAPLKPGVMEIRAEFALDAIFGVASWDNPDVPALPGTLLILMPEYDSALRSMAEGVFPSLNLWPPRVIDVPSDFRSVRSQEQYDPADPNFAMLAKLPPAFTRNIVRTSEGPAAYPRFKVTGLTPSRAPIYALGGLFGAFLTGAGVYAATRGRRPDQPSESVLSKA